MSSSLSRGALASACLVLASCAAQAGPREERGNTVTIEIVDAGGRRFEQFPIRARGDSYRAYLEAERGAPYRIRVENGSGERVGVVIAVDGRNIISGSRSELRRDEPMYVLTPWAHQEYSGWRTSLDDVHEFYFTEWKDSYAEAFADRSAKGVIAVAVYREKAQLLSPQPYSPHRERDRKAASGSESRASSADEAGTGFGDRRHEPAVRIAFEAEPAAVSKTFLKYEWPETLCRKGIAHCGRERNRFWDEDLAFAPYPKR